MNKDFGKGLIILLTIVTIAIIIITVLILKLEKNKTINTDNINNNVILNISENTEEVKSLTDKKRFFTVSECISKFLNNQLYFVPLKMNILESSNIDSYIVYGLTADKNYENMEYVYYIVKLDSFNSTYSVETVKGNYNDINDIKLENKDIEIKNDNNFSYIEVEDFYIIKNYINYYKILALSNSDLVYNHYLDTEYKNEKFIVIDDFKQYLNSNKSNILETTIMKYSVEEFENYKQYTILDNHNNYFIIREKGVMDISILLDNYTVGTQEFNEEYSNASENIKIATNIDKIFKMLNNKEYKIIYERYLNLNFKNNYFGDYQRFEEFINDKFFDYNYLGSTSIEEQSGYYIITVNYKDGISSAAELRKINIIMNLKTDNSFEFSFEI